MFSFLCAVKIVFELGLVTCSVAIVKLVRLVPGVRVVLAKPKFLNLTKMTVAGLEHRAGPRVSTRRRDGATLS